MRYLDYTLPSDVEDLVLEDIGGATAGTGNSLNNDIRGNSLAAICCSVWAATIRSRAPAVPTP